MQIIQIKNVTLQIMRAIKVITIISVLISVFASCNSHEKLLKSNDYDKKYAAAMKYYEDANYSKAIQMFENLSIYYRGRDNAENVAWYHAESNLKINDYYTAGYLFDKFVRQFPYSERAGEALFMSAFCKYKESPEYSLDQTQTKEAIIAFEQYVERYPTSNHIPEINRYLDEMRYKLMKKDYEIAYGYYKTSAYNAAYVSFSDFMNQYPDSENKEDAMYYIIKSGYEYAINSTETKIVERLQKVINDFEKFATLFSNSKYMSSSQDIYNKCREELRKRTK